MNQPGVTCLWVMLSIFFFAFNSCQVIRGTIQGNWGQHRDSVLSLLREAAWPEPRLLGSRLRNLLVQWHHRSDRRKWGHLKGLWQVQTHWRCSLWTNGPGDSANTTKRQWAILLQDKHRWAFQWQEDNLHFKGHERQVSEWGLKFYYCFHALYALKCWALPNPKLFFPKAATTTAPTTTTVQTTEPMQTQTGE